MEEKSVSQSQECEYVQQYAGFWIRAFAYLIDCAIMIIPCMIINFIIAYKFNSITHAPGQELDIWVKMMAALVGADFLIWLIYYAGFQASPLMATLGQLYCGLNVINTTGGKISLDKAICRYCSLCLVMFIPYFVGIFGAAFHPKKQGFHDLMVKTYVIQKRVVTVPNNCLAS